MFLNILNFISYSNIYLFFFSYWIRLKTSGIYLVKKNLKYNIIDIILLIYTVEWSTNSNDVLYTNWYEVKPQIYTFDNSNCFNTFVHKNNK